MKRHPVLKMNCQRKSRKMCYHCIKKEISLSESDDMDSGKDEAVIDRNCGSVCCVDENTQRKKFFF